MAGPVRRPTARVVPVNRHGEVLLLVIVAADGGPGLMTTGGGIEPGETPRDAAVRELHEETGIAVAVEALVGPFHHGTHDWTDSHGVARLSESQFFATAVDDVEISFAGHQPEELGFVVGHEWLDPAELADDPRVRHPQLPHIARTAVALLQALDHVVHRVTARVLPVSPDGAVLLLEEQDPAQPGGVYWASIGGAIDPGESLRDAAVRELHEESGIIVDADQLVGPVHQLVDPFSWNGVDYVGDSTYFALRLDRDIEVSFDLLEPEEVGNVLGAAWLTPAELAARPTFRPSGLPDIMRAAVAAVAVAGGVQ